LRLSLKILDWHAILLISRYIYSQMLYSLYVRRNVFKAAWERLLVWNEAFMLFLWPASLVGLVDRSSEQLKMALNVLRRNVPISSDLYSLSYCVAVVNWRSYSIRRRSAVQ
jgi:hypothetical protein